MHWRAKLLIKRLCGSIPALGYALRQAGYSRHGSMDNRVYAIAVLSRHLAQAFIQPLQIAQAGPQESPFENLRRHACQDRGTCLEIGPGESLMTMIVARAAGFRRTLLVDHGNQLRGSAMAYVQTADLLRSHGFDIPEITFDDGLDRIMERYNATYLTSGLESMREIENASVDFSFSQAVLEHIPKVQAAEYIRQLLRVGRHSCPSSHRIDLKDHLGGSINHLRFAEEDWEKPSIYSSGIYTNRLRHSHWCDLFELAAAPYRIVNKEMFPELPCDRNLLSEEFRHLPDEDLLTSGFDVILKCG